MIDLLILPFFTCIALVLIHVYFGSFVIKKGIIFIDLALAQWAALGYMVGYWLHIHNPVYLFLTGFGFTLIAALGLTLGKKFYQKTNTQEAIIGISYIAAIAIAVSLITTLGLEGHHLKDMLAGHLLFIQTSELISAYIIYAIIGTILYFIHKKLVESTALIWDFVFYALFGLVVTSSVKMVGILLVFSFLVVPFLSVLKLKTSFKNRLIIAWVVGVISTILGLCGSIYFDIPPSITIIFSLILLWVLSIPIIHSKKSA